MTLKKYDLQGKELGELKYEEGEVKAHPQMVKDYIVAIRANKRQWSACTKGRSEISHSTKKPHAQKGTGSARQGTLAAPQCRGGGVVFGPKPKFNQHVRINKKERRQAIAFLLQQKIHENKVFILGNVDIKEPKTRLMASFLKKQGILGRSVLFVGEENNFKLSCRNIVRSSFVGAQHISGYDLLASQYLVMTESSFDQMKEMVKR